MPASDANITEVRISERDADARIAWTSTDPIGTRFQLYLDGVLTWSGTARSICLPRPIHGRTARVDVVAVGPTEARTDFGADLADGTGQRARLWWYGGLYLGGDPERFAIFRGTVAGGAVSYAAPVGFVPLYEGQPLDGFGLGPFGAGGFGSSASEYAWTSDPLPPGVWHFAVVAYDAAGNPGSVQTYAVTIAAPPQTPPADPSGRRLTGTYNATTHVLTLAWLTPTP